MGLFDKLLKRDNPSNHSDEVKAAFEAELHKRGVTFGIDPNDGRHALKVSGGHVLVSLDNIRRSYERDRDLDAMRRFVDTVLNTPSETGISAVRLYWCLEPNDYQEAADFRLPMSDRVNRVLVHVSANGQNITWISPTMLEELGLSESEASNAAFANLARAMSEATLEAQDIEGVELGMIGTALPFKTALILAPNIKEVLGERLGWPLLAVVPDRDFLYVWAERHTDFVGRVGHVVVREFQQAPYPISSEVYRLSDEGVKAIGEFPVPT